MLALARMARVAIDRSSHLLVAFQAPRHKGSIHHFRGSIRHAGNPVTGRAIDTSLNMDPVRKNDKRRKLIHPLPRNRLAVLHIPDHLQSLRSLADCVGGMAGLAEFNVRDACDTISFDIAVAESAVQFGHLFVMDVIESNGLVDHNLRKNRKDSIEDALRLSAKTIVSHGGEQREDDESNAKINPFSHINNLLKRV